MALDAEGTNVRRYWDISYVNRVRLKQPVISAEAYLVTFDRVPMLCKTFERAYTLDLHASVRCHVT